MENEQDSRKLSCKNTIKNLKRNFKEFESSHNFRNLLAFIKELYRFGFGFIFISLFLKTNPNYGLVSDFELLSIFTFSLNCPADIFPLSIYYSDDINFG